MAFGKNFAELIGRLGADASINHLPNGGRVANLNVATDESYIDRQTGERVDKTEWHRVVTFQDGLVGMLEKNAKKGRLIHVQGKIQTRKWRKPGEDFDRFSTEIIVVPGHRVQFYDKPKGNDARPRRPSRPWTRPPRRRPAPRTSRTRRSRRASRSSLLPPASGAGASRRSPFFGDGLESFFSISMPRCSGAGVREKRGKGRSHLRGERA